VLKVYLAGKMGGRMGAEVLVERDRAIDACTQSGLIPIDPAASEMIDPARPVDLAMSLELMKEYVAKDEYAVRHCDVLIVLTGDTPSEGTGQEIALASFLNKPIIMVAPQRLRGHLVGFWNIKASKIVETVEDAVDHITENYGMGEY
jgi:nucleoside 2-deoxyribosyltransferase